MSVEAITWALKQPIEHSSAKFVLVVLANCASADTMRAHPSTGYLCDATGQDRKTVLANLGRLREWGYLEDTGLRTGATRQVIVYQLRTPSDPTNDPENGTVPPPVEESQKRNSSENGTVPKTAGNSPKNGTRNRFKALSSLSTAREPIERSPTAPAVTPAGQAAIALTKAGFRCTSQDPRLLAAIRAGATVEHLLEIAAFPECQGKPTAYVIAIAERELRDQRAMPAEPISSPSTDTTTGTALTHPATERRRSQPQTLSRTAQGIAALEEMKRGLAR